MDCSLGGQREKPSHFDGLTAMPLNHQTDLPVTRANGGRLAINSGIRTHGFSESVVAVTPIHD
jgi:hypothetical protein